MLVGFGYMQELAERAARGSDGYPPYNIEELDSERLRITLAVAGFSNDDLAISIEDRQLIVRGKRQDGEERVFLHRGIAARRFQRAFVLADGHEVERAFLENGLLHLDVRRRPRQETIVQIPIETSARR